MKCGESKRRRGGVTVTDGPFWGRFPRSTQAHDQGACVLGWGRGPRSPPPKLCASSKQDQEQKLMRS